MKKEQNLQNNAEPQIGYDTLLCGVKHCLCTYQRYNEDSNEFTCGLSEDSAELCTFNGSIRDCEDYMEVTIWAD